MTDIPASIFIPIPIASLSDVVDGTSNALFTTPQSFRFSDMPLIGAAGDGITDDTAAVSAAITAAVLAGKNLFIPAGNYLISTVGISSSIKIFGIPKFTKFTQKASTSDNMFNITGSGIQVEFSDMSMDGNWTNQASQSYNRSVYSSATGVANSTPLQLIFRNIEFTNSAYAAISVWGDNDDTTREILWIEDCRFYNGAQGVDNSGSNLDYIPRDIDIVAAVEFFITRTDHNSDTAPTVGRCALCIEQSEGEVAHYSRGHISAVTANRRGCNVSQALGAFDFYIWAQDLHVSDVTILNSSYTALKWKQNGANLIYENIVIDGVVSGVSAVAGNNPTYGTAADGLIINGMIVRNAAASTYNVLISSLTGSTYSQGIVVNNLILKDNTGNGVEFGQCKNVTYIEPTIIGGAIGSSFQQCDGICRLVGGRHEGQSGYGVYVDNNASTFDFQWSDGLVHDNTSSGYSVYVDARNVSVEGVRFDNVHSALNWGSCTTVKLGNIMGTNIASTGLAGGSATNVMATGCFINTGITQWSAGTVTNLTKTANNF